MYEKAVEIATTAHKGQTRRGGEPYITHPLAVASQFRDHRLKTVAVLHDVLEDTDVLQGGLLAWEISADVVRILVHLTHLDGESYADYINRLRVSPNAVAVKIADLHHNLSDLDPKRNRQRKDKYELALKLLEA